ncbi:ABC-type branched-subunit amino acid transport system ATPase component [Nocardioides sp. BE266]|uniref:hypothetical protein n=1 Tax=Nocardioides sp. BE266 TaxID=2817725 RepID=UPI002862A979|nr:hypothetical protein [Nocardioides sp. BE266]MDR7255064.1 ABC-type branched-subunit amino acid transport system ATPase component [Nocardioides sp. BE266]
MVLDRILQAVDVMRDAGKAILIVEQDTEVALCCCDHGYVLADGCIVASGSAAELRADKTLEHAYLGDG